MSKLFGFLNNSFKLEEKGTNVKTEFRAGLTTFMAMVYILMVNAGMFTATGVSYEAMYITTALAAIIGTVLIGLLAGLIGIGFTYFASFIVNLILKPLIGYAHIAALPIGQAILLVLLSIGLTCVSGLIPARSAAKKDPVIALRTE